MRGIIKVTALLLTLSIFTLALASCDLSGYDSRDKGCQETTTEKPEGTTAQTTQTMPQESTDVQTQREEDTPTTDGTYSGGTFTQTLQNETPISWHQGGQWLTFTMNNGMKNEVVTYSDATFCVKISFEVMHPRGWELEEAYITNLKNGGERFHIVENAMSLKSTTYTKFNGEFYIKGSLFKEGNIYLYLAGEPINLLGSDNDYSVKNAKISISRTANSTSAGTKEIYTQILCDENPMTWRDGGKWLTFTMSEPMKVAIENNPNMLLNVSISFEAMHPNEYGLVKVYASNLKEGGERFNFINSTTYLSANTYTEFSKNFQINTNLVRDGQIYLYVEGAWPVIIGENYSLKNAKIMVSFAENQNNN